MGRIGDYVRLKQWEFRYALETRNDRSKGPVDYHFTKQSYAPPYFKNGMPLENKWYGHDHWLANVVKSHLSRGNYRIEHGIMRSSPPKDTLDEDKAFSRTIFVQGNSRLEFYNREGLTAIPIGPYIRHVENADYEINEEKEIVTLFPFHSHQNNKMVDAPQHYANVNASLRSRDLRVFICLHFRDLNNATKTFFRNAMPDLDLTFVSAGLPNQNFLPRLKCILQNSAFCLTNGWGTHVGYSYELGTPMCYIRGPFEFSGSDAFVSSISQASKNMECFAYDQLSENPGAADQLLSQYWNLHNCPIAQMLPNHHHKAILECCGL